MRFLISFLVSVLNQLWILRGHFLCCRSLMKLQGTPYCRGGGRKRKIEEVKVKSRQLGELAPFQQFEMVTLLTCTQEVVKNSLFLLKLGKNKQSEVLEQHEAH